MKLDGWRDLWGLSWNPLNWGFILLLLSVLVGFWGYMAWTGWTLVRDIWALPPSLRSIIGALAGSVLGLGYWAWLNEKAIKSLQAQLDALQRRSAGLDY